jgi:hypothetical protein
LQRGLPDLARYAGTFAVLVAGVAVVLRVVRPRRRRRPAAVQRTTPAAAARSRTDRAA